MINIDIQELKHLYYYEEKSLKLLNTSRQAHSFLEKKLPLHASWSYATRI